MVSVRRELTAEPLNCFTPYPLPVEDGSKFENRILLFRQQAYSACRSTNTEATMKKTEELVIITKTYDLILWS